MWIFGSMEWNICIILYKLKSKEQGHSINGTTWMLNEDVLQKKLWILPLRQIQQKN